jgi:hypothetical protein
MRTLSRNREPRSSTVTSAPGDDSAQTIAAKNPAAPPPTTITFRERMAQHRKFLSAWRNFLQGTS